MGMLVEGVWKTEDQLQDESGRFRRRPTRFRGRVTASGESGYPAAAGRYHLYVSLACPWAHRTLIMRKLKGLESAIPVSVVAPLMLEDGWEFSDEYPDRLGGRRYLRELYLEAQPDYTGRVTVPVLWDSETRTIVNNESREIMRMLDLEFGEYATRDADLCPENLRSQIDETIDSIYEPVNNGVYRAGFASRQEAYEEAVTGLFEALDHWEEVLGERRYLCGDRPTEADVCMFTTLVRFDPVYHGHFKCNLRRIVDYPNLWRFTREIYGLPGVAETVDVEHIKLHYYGSHRSINPTGIVPKGPVMDFGLR
ncbi:glutathione S-transferase family protein [Rubrobacter taiwanensis]|jgi:putative glutathione S-transferase|uniref:Glutathione S-transferase family protein n=1 Tax=Rubrobacter taiwanensis TaxID=185139 RepID=A0A4R1BDJ6_9ACTN|nr:glutathione S-transferase family protein [Rubrobacter taiwanensis]TCJ15114.1 glutathione S-transferase family protein [Rubrobacter taiwanensis]